MSSLAAFVRRLFEEGEITLQGRPTPAANERTEAAAILAEAYAVYRLEIAGPLLEFDVAIAIAASEVVWLASWFLVNHQETDTDVEKCLILPAKPRSAAQHLSADLTLRYLPQLHRRAHSLAPGDKLTAQLGQLLRQWPLSGVLSDVAEPPLSPLDFDGHPGLRLLYAERLAEKNKPAWLPEAEFMEYVELVFHELGKEHTLRLNAKAREQQQNVADDGDPVS